jgi:hypothetical protein
MENPLMCHDRIEHQKLSVFSPYSRAACHPPPSVLTEVDRVLDGVVFRFGKPLQPSLNKCWRLLSSKRVVAIVREIRQRLNRNRIAIIEPEQYGRLKLSFGRIPLVIDHNFSRCVGVDSWSRFVQPANLTLAICDSGSILNPCQSVTKAKRPWSKSRRLPNPSRSMARICLARPISSASYARPKSARQSVHPSHRASSRSSRPEKLFSRFLARFTFASVSVTRYGFLPSGGRPAPSLFPPILGFFMPEKIYTNYVDAS